MLPLPPLVPLPCDVPAPTGVRVPPAALAALRDSASRWAWRAVPCSLSTTRVSRGVQTDTPDTKQADGTAALLAAARADLEVQVRELQQLQAELAAVRSQLREQAGPKRVDPFEAAAAKRPRHDAGGFQTALELNAELQLKQQGKVAPRNGGRMPPLREPRNSEDHDAAPPATQGPMSGLSYAFNDPQHRTSLERKSSNAAETKKKASDPASGKRNGTAPSKKTEATAPGGGIEPHIIETIESEILDSKSPISWDDIAGLEHAKQAIYEIVIWPLQHPALFAEHTLRRPSKGVLLFGPPGTGKTLIARTIASQVKATFFAISASSLTSKWMGEGEKLVRALFHVAHQRQPSVVFVDEVDSLLSNRSAGEHDAARRIKTEFLVQFDGAATRAQDRVLVIGATNRPQELDEAARRRFKKRLLIPLPDARGRRQLLQTQLNKPGNRHTLTDADLDRVVRLTRGYSGYDLTALLEDAAYAPIRELAAQNGHLTAVTPAHVRPLTVDDLVAAARTVKPSVAPADVAAHLAWDAEFGSGHRGALGAADDGEDGERESPPPVMPGGASGKGDGVPAAAG